MSSGRKWFPLSFNPRTCGGGAGGRTDHPWFFANNSRKTRRIAAKLDVPSRWPIWHTVKISSQCHFRSSSYDVIYQVMLGRNRQILRSVPQWCAFLLPSVWVCIPYEFIGVYGCLDNIAHNVCYILFWYTQAFRRYLGKRKGRQQMPPPPPRGRWPGSPPPAGLNRILA